ncbi:hypothetical protein D3C86_1773230 [compost metagenome]
MSRHITGHFTAPGGVTDVHGIPDIQVRHQFSDVGGVGVHVVADSGLGGAAMTAAIMGDDAKTLAEEEQHLRIPVVTGQWPAVVEYDRLTAAPVLVENLRAVLDGDHPRTTGTAVAFAARSGGSRCRCLLRRQRRQCHRQGCSHGSGGDQTTACGSACLVSHVHYSCEF